MGKTITRREFVKGTAGMLGVAGISAVMGCSAAQTPTNETTAGSSTAQSEPETTSAPPQEATKPAYDWSEAADVVVVGGGGAGFCAAIEAGRAGADVLILEKSSVCGGDSLLCGGVIMASGTDFQKSFGIEDTTESFVKQQLSYLGDYGDPEMVREMCEASPDEVQFMLDMGRKYDECLLMPPAWGYDTDDTWARRTHSNLSESPEHFLLLKKTVDGMDNIRYYTDAEVTNLITNDTGEVIGVKIADGSLYRANKGVILSTASFGRNKEMCRQYNQMGYWALDYIDKLGEWGAVCQSAKNTGDGIRMAQEIGADLALSPANCVNDTTCAGHWWSECSKILVNKQGVRFVQENANWGYFNSRVYQEAVARNDLDPLTSGFYFIMDQSTIEKSDVVSAVLNEMGGSAKSGFAERFMVQADTIRELAEKVGLPADRLQQTVERWNSFCDAGEDLDFGRRNVDGREELIRIERAPFYAIKYYPIMLGSFGGVRTNRDTQVIHVNGSVIPRLYAAGSTMSGMYVGSFYPACGWSILGTVHWGRKAGVHAAGLQPWTTETVEPKPRKESPVPVAAKGNYKAGTYTASGKGRNGDISVTVEFSDTEILSVKINDHVETAGISDPAIEQMPERILAAQSADVDAISSVTYTSEGILEAVRDCISQAQK